MKFLSTIAVLLGVTCAVKIQNVHDKPVTDIFALLAKKGRDGKKCQEDGTKIDILTTLSAAIENDHDKDALTKEDVMSQARAWLAMKEIEMPDGDLVTVVDSLFDELDQDKDGRLTKNEILGAAFKMMDKNEDGTISKRELFRLVRVYATFLKVDLKEGWKKDVQEWYHDVDQGISADELTKFLAKEGTHVHSLAEAVKSLAEK